MSLAEWVRQALESALRQEPSGSVSKTLDCIRVATQHEFPAGDVADILREIESGYAGATNS